MDINVIFNNLIIYGPLGIIAIVETWTIRFLYIENKKLQDKRIEDAKQIASTIMEPLAEMNNTLKNHNTILNTILTAIQNGRGGN